MVTVITSFVFYSRNVNDPTNDLRTVVAGTYWIAVLFTGLLVLPRTFLAEDEGGTLDFLRVLCRPHAVWWGKLLFNLAQGLTLSTATMLLFLALVGPRVAHPGMLALSVVGGTGAIVGTVTLCGAIAAGATGRATLAATIAVPLLLGVIQQAVAATKSAFGAGLAGFGWTSAVGLIGYAIVATVIGPWILALSWTNSSPLDPPSSRS